MYIGNSEREREREKRRICQSSRWWSKIIAVYRSINLQMLIFLMFAIIYSEETYSMAISASTLFTFMMGQLSHVNRSGLGQSIWGRIRNTTVSKKNFPIALFSNVSLSSVLDEKFLAEKHALLAVLESVNDVAPASSSSSNTSWSTTLRKSYLIFSYPSVSLSLSLSLSFFFFFFCPHHKHPFLLYSFLPSPLCTYRMKMRLTKEKSAAQSFATLTNWQWKLLLLLFYFKGWKGLKSSDITYDLDVSIYTSTTTLLSIGLLKSLSCIEIDLMSPHLCTAWVESRLASVTDFIQVTWKRSYVQFSLEKIANEIFYHTSTHKTTHNTHTFTHTEI